jgi:hypothetical protein
LTNCREWLLQNNPTGKYLLFFVNHVKAKNKKYFALSEGQISGINLPVSPDRGAFRERQERVVGCGGRRGAGDDGADAYGKGVWS